MAHLTRYQKQLLIDFKKAQDMMRATRTRMQAHGMDLRFFTSDDHDDIHMVTYLANGALTEAEQQEVCEEAAPYLDGTLTEVEPEEMDVMKAVHEVVLPRF